MKKYSLHTLVLVTFALLASASVGSVYFFASQHRNDLINASQEEKINLVKMIDDVLSSPRYLYEMAKAPGLERLLVTELASFKDVRFLRIVTAEGVIYSSNLDADWGKTINEPLLTKALVSKTAQIKDDWFDKEKIKVIIYPGGGGKVLMIGFSLAAIEKAVKAMFLRDIIAILGGLLLTYFAIFLMLRLAIIAPLKKVIFICKQIRQGDFSHNILSKSKTEIGELATTFNAMVNDVKLSRQALEIKVAEATEARKKTEEERNKTRATLIGLSDGLLVFGKSKRLVLVNRSAEKFLEIKEKQVLNKTLPELSGFPLLAALLKAINNRLEPSDKKFGLAIKKSIGYYFQIAVTSVSAGRQVVGYTLVLHDITREKEIDKIKTEFVSVAAHQLRTPLSAVKWSLKMILDGDCGQINSEQKDLLAKGYKNNERMIDLVNDLLSVSRMEEGKFGYDFKPADLKEVVALAAENLEDLIAKNKLRLIINLPRGLPLVSVDKEKIMLALENLLDNAIKYSPAGGQIALTVKTSARSLTVSVKDSGIGIPQAEQKKIFSKFFRATNAVKLETEGTGLGLFLAKNIIVRHGGKINILSQPGQGTEASFTLPLANSGKTAKNTIAAEF